MTLLEYIGKRTKNPDETKFSVFLKTYDKGKYREPTEKEINSKDTRCDEFLCYKNGFIVSREDLIDYFYKKSGVYVNLPELTKDEENAIMEYSGPRYKEINNYLRFSEVHDDYVSKTSEDLNNAIQKFETKKPAILFRGSYFKEEGNVGDFFEDKGFPSCSSDFQVAKKFRNKKDKFVNIILVPEGSKALPLGSLSDHQDENEILLPKNTKFQILGIDKKKRIMISCVSDFSLMPEETPAQKYISGVSLEDVFEEMDDGSKIRAFDFRRVKENYEYQEKEVLEDNPDFDSDVYEEYQELLKQKENLDKDSDEYAELEEEIETFELMNETLIQKKIPVIKNVRVKDDSKLDFSDDYMRDLDNSCLLEFEKKGDKIIAREYISGKKTYENEYPRNKKNISKIQDFFDSDDVMIF